MRKILITLPALVLAIEVLRLRWLIQNAASHCSWYFDCNALVPVDFVKSGGRTPERAFVVLMSDRVEGIIPALGSLTDASNDKLEVLLIGDVVSGQHARRHFKGRIDMFHLLTIEEVETDLLSQGITPIWKWNDFGSSHAPTWKNNNTIHLAPWDGLPTHENILNHARFYLPHLSILKDVQHYFLIDDDIIVQTDLGSVAQAAKNIALDESAGLVCPCNVWKWDSTCSKYEFKSQEEKIKDSPPLYGTASVCTSDTQEECVPDSFQAFLQTVTRNDTLENELVWNFGFCFVPKANWQTLQLTERYESVMKTSYKDHIFPENSLAFGLGVAYLAFAGSISCWGDDVKVRDGFGFVEPQSFEETFGKDFAASIDVLHYTGPAKPWTENAAIRSQTHKPWLARMEREGMRVPTQLSSKPTNTVFSVLTSWRSGSEWVFDMLDQHPNVCASGESFSPQRGFPTEALNINESPWIPDCSLKKGCSLRFVLDKIEDLTKDLPANVGTMPPRCVALSRNNFEERDQEPLSIEHLTRLCNFVDTLNGNYTPAAVTKAWVDAYVSENQDLIGCSCPMGTHIKGLKVMGDWIVDLNGTISRISNFDQTAFGGSKVIRFKRENLFERYKSLVTAKSSGIWHARTNEESIVGGDQMITVSIKDMLRAIQRMETVDQKADEWARKHASEVLWVDYEDCKAAPLDCFNNMFQFLGVDRLENLKQQVLPFAKGSGPHLLDSIKNKREVREALHANGWGRFIGQNDEYREVQLLVYETKLVELMAAKSNSQYYLRKANRVQGINATIFGQNTDFRGFGSKYHAVLPHLQGLDPDSVVVISDSRDVLINLNSNMAGSYAALAEFKQVFEELTHGNPEAVVVSTEAQCCVSALTHFQPGDLFDDTGHRTNSRACYSGKKGCGWMGDRYATPWKTFMEDLASERGYASFSDVYLNAGLIAGRAKSLLGLIGDLSIEESEDDQAVFTDYLFRNPNDIVLDYEQRLFGSNRWADGMEDGGCVFEMSASGRALSHIETGSQPLFVHSNGGFFECQQKLKYLLNNKSPRQLASSPDEGRRTLKNYGSTKTPKTHSTKTPTIAPTSALGTEAPNVSTKAAKANVR